MAARSFTIFQDDDVAPPTVTTRTTPVTRSMTATMSNAINTLATIVAEADKENLHPLTGERAGPTPDGTGKKRKNSVSSVKTLAPLESKATKLADAEPELKKRKPLSSGTAVRKPKAGKKDVKGARKVSKRSSRAPSPMPKVDEEVEVERDNNSLTQREIDAKCYDLTVKPLADVSQAFSQRSPLQWLEEEFEESEEAKIQFAKEVSLEPEFRDIYTPASVGLAASESTTTPDNVLTTPERKHICHAFTFSSPVRMMNKAKMVRSASVPRLAIPALTSSASS